MQSSKAMSGCAAATSRATRRNRPSVSFMMLALCTAVTLAAAVRAGVVEGVAHDALAAAPGDDLDGLGHVGGDLVLDAGVQVLGVLAHDHQVDAGVAAGHAHERPRRPQAGVQVERLAQRHVDRRETPSRPAW